MPASCCIAESETLPISLSLQMAPTHRGGVSPHLCAKCTYDTGEGITITYLSLSKNTDHTGITSFKLKKSSSANP